MALEDMLERYGIGGISQMMPEIYNKPIAALKQTKPRNRRMGDCGIGCAGTRTAATVALP